MSISFRPAVRENVGLLIGLAGGTGSGKTYSALRLASGICGDRPFALIDTESRRALHYADQFKFHHAELRPPFRPEAYADAIEAADKAGYPVIVVDSVSHEWSGDGGVLDWQEEVYKRLGDRESTKLLSWSAPKQGHKKMVSRLLQSRAHLILCFRAEPHIEMVKEGGKTKIVPKVGLTGLDGWFPVTEKNLPFELTASFLLMAEAPGVPRKIKLQEQHKALFPLDRPITEDSGRLIAQWAAGGTNKEPEGRHEPAAADQTLQGRPVSAVRGTAPADVGSQEGVTARRDEQPRITVDQVTYLGDQCREHGIATAKLCEKAGVPGIGFILAQDYQRAVDWLNASIERRKSA